ncbi:putative secreted protein (Por secretion system target) [Marinoscillum furvescens DSM 4134]|uniref:Putative secreted protein (Por secretion system target) n=2 Tax=Marinoscillum furvescens TaxID=1026 RepID=A0A3D9KZZ8_MARFU|nr:putative secreted protein (Por secretion system target) [Marinoscillum furvescens DSM 4134]
MIVSSLRFFFVVIGCLCAISLFATDYYVAKNGDDSNPGTEDEPFLTIGKAATVLQAGDVCYIKEGVYRERVKTTNSGTAASPIVFKAFAGDPVVVTGTEALTAWEVHDGPIYKTSATMTLPVRFRALYVGGKSMDVARWPNNTDQDPFTIDAEPVDNGSRSHIERSTIPAADWSGGYIWYLGAHSGASWTRPVTASSAGRVDFPELPDKWPFNPHNPTVIRNENRGRFFLFGKLAALDAEEEWFYDEEQNELYLYAPSGADPNTLAVEVSARTETFELTHDYITVEDLHVFGGAVRIAGNYCEVRNCVIQYGHNALDELDNSDAQDARGSITIEGSHNLIEQNLIEFGSANGVACLYAWKNSTSNTIHNNIIRSFNTVGIHSNLIRSSIPQMTITNNTLYLAGRDGIYNSGSNGEIAYNDVYDVMRINNDAGIFYTVGKESDKNTVIHHNWFHDSAGPEYADGRAAGIYLDNHSKGYTVHHNMVWNITWTGIQINWDNWNIDIYNNSIYEAESAMGRWAGPNGTNYTIDDIVIENNYANSGEWIGTHVSTETNKIDPNDPFVDYSAQDFMPGNSSGLIDGGKVIAGITDGYQGAAPDIGAYESGTTAWVAGADWEAYPLQFFDSGNKEEEEEEKEVLSSRSVALKVYPNPTSDQVTVTSAYGVDAWMLSDVFGRRVNVRMLDSATDELVLDVSGLAPGWYLLRCQIGRGSVARHIVVNR